MILQNTKSESAGFSLMQLLGGSSKESDNSAFSLLLKQLGLSAESLTADESLMEFGDVQMMQKPQKRENASRNMDLAAFLAAFESVDETKLQVLQSVSSVEENEDEDFKILNPKLMQTLPLLSLKQVLSDAKVFLKEQIRELASSKGIEIDIETLPKTLKSLSLVAEKIGIQLDKITLETIQTKGTILEQSDKKTSILQPQSKPVEHSTQEFVQLRKEKLPNDAATTLKDVQPSLKDEPLKALLHVPVLDKKELHKKEQTVELSKEVGTPKITEDTVIKTIKTAQQAISEPSVLKEVNTALRQTVNKEPLKAARQESKTTDIVQNAVLDSEVQEQRAVQNPLKDHRSDVTDTASKLSSLLHGEEQSEGDSNTPKNDAKVFGSVSAEPKAVAMDVKINEAKQMLTHLATDLKEAVENYKPPFTRVKLQLNPVKLGEVDITMVQRGNNVHISVSSNNSAITILAQNSVELKTQLANNGLANATMQFNTNGGEQQRQNQHQQNMMEIYEKYAELDNEDNFETLHSLELIVPRYV